MLLLLFLRLIISDHYKWVLKSQGYCKDDASDAIGTGIRNITFKQEGIYEDLVAFSESSMGEPLALCWQFTEGAFFFLGDITMNILSIDSFTSADNNQLVLRDVPKEYSIIGYGQSNEDVVYVAAGDDIQCEQPIYTFELNEELNSVSITLSTYREDGYSVCYYFAF